MQLPDEVKRFLEEAALAALCLELDLGHGTEAALAVKASGDLLRALRDASAQVDVGWVVEPTQAGPVTCLVLRGRAGGVGDLVAEVYFDVLESRDRELMEHLERQEALRIVFLDEELTAIWSATLPWGELRRLEAQQVRDRAEELAERCDRCDFEAARETFQEGLGMDRLEERAFRR